MTELPTPPGPSPASEATARWSKRRELHAALLCAAILVVLRSAVFVVDGAMYVNSDQAVFGLAAKHIAEGRAFPVLSYSEHYMLMIESWLAAPIFWATGTSSPVGLKLPVLAINLLTAILLVLCLVRQSGIRPFAALVLSLFFILPAPATARLLTDTAGANIEPFLWILLLWLLQSRPVAFGVVLAVGFLNREFTAYGLAAILLLDALDRSMFTRAYARKALVAAASFGVTWQLINVAELYSSAFGPKTSIDTLSTSTGGSFLARFCFAPETIPRTLVRLAQDTLGILFGGSRMPLALIDVYGAGVQGLPGLWLVAGGLLALLLALAIWWTVTGRARPWTGALRFPTFLFLVGLQAALVYAVSRCGRLEFATMRYILLSLLGATGLAAFCYKTEPVRRLRPLALVPPILLAGTALWSHAWLAVEHVTNPPANPRAILARDLMAHDERFGTAGFWDAYVVTFLTGERVILASEPPRILEYWWLVDAAGSDAVTVQRAPCEGGRRVADVFYVCHQGSP